MNKAINLGNSYMNVYLLPIPDGYVLLDTGYFFNYKGFIRQAKKKKIDLNSIRYLVITHVHADHVGFAQKLLQETNAKLILVQEDKERALRGKNVEDVFISRRDYWLLSKCSVALSHYTQEFPPVTAESIDPLTQPLAEYGMTFSLLHGHTSNDLCLRIGDDLYCGDICMSGAGAANHSPMWIENNDLLVQSWEEILASGVKTIYPAHGKPFTTQTLAACLEKQRGRKVYKL